MSSVLPETGLLICKLASPMKLSTERLCSQHSSHVCMQAEASEQASDSTDDTAHQLSGLKLQADVMVNCELHNSCLHRFIRHAVHQHRQPGKLHYVNRHAIACHFKEPALRPNIVVLCLVADLKQSDCHAAVIIVRTPLMTSCQSRFLLC